MKLRSDDFLHRRFLSPRCAFGRHRFFPRDLEPHERFELSANRNPHLAWEEVPDGVKSFALLMQDHDAPADAALANQPGTSIPRDAARATFTHWVLVDVPSTTRDLAEGAVSDGVVPRGKGADPSAIGRSGINDYTTWFAEDAEMAGTYHGYDGPCPPWNDELIHGYVFTLYALDVATLDVGAQLTAESATRAMKGHVLAEASLEGFYFINPEARFR